MIAFLPPARALRDDLERSLHLEMYQGTGDLALTSLRALQEGIGRITDDPYVTTLQVVVPEGAGDKEKVSLARLAAGQLTAYLEGQTGLPSASSSGGGGKDDHSIQIYKAPYLHLNEVSGVPHAAMERLVENASAPRPEEE
jgi:hypothetical protein